jgi:exosortase E/protease (VPEID-CTERM system)
LSCALESSSPSYREVTFPYHRWAALVAVLLGEIVVLTISFDGKSIASQYGWWFQWLPRPADLARAAIAAGVATLLFGGARLRREWLRQASGAHPGERSSIPLLAHLAAFAAFAWITALVCGGGLVDSPYPAGWIIAWFGTGLITLACWSAAAIPPRMWLPLARGGASAIAAGVAVGFVAWALGQLVEQIWRPLAVSTFVVVHILLRLVFNQTVIEPEHFLVGTPTFQVVIAPECSGYEGIGLIWAFLAAYLWLGRGRLRFPQAFLLIPLGTTIIWLANAARIAALIAIGTGLSADIATGGFHSQAGWLAFNAVALGIILVSRRWLFFSRVTPDEVHRDGWNPAAACLMPLLSIVAVTMLAGAFTAGFDGFYPLRVLTAAGVLYHFRHAYAGIWKRPSWQSIAVGIATFIAWMILEPSPANGGADSPLALSLARWPTAGALTWLACRVAGSIVTVPIAEELAFRGYLIRRLTGNDVHAGAPVRFGGLAFLLSSILFGALHGRWLAGTLAGMAYALVLYRRGELVDAIAAHATTNALIAVVVLATGSWSLWS